MKIGFLGAGSWGFCLSLLLASKGYHVQCWSKNQEFLESIKKNNEHPLFPGHQIPKNLVISHDLQATLDFGDVWIESISSQGIRPVFEQIKASNAEIKPLILTSKGIEQKTGHILPKVIKEIFGDDFNKVGVLSGPSFAQDVAKGLPTSVVGSGYDDEIIQMTCQLFSGKNFRVYPNNDLIGVCFGGALKNIIAIACGIAAGLGLGHSCAAALMTRGLHEIKKLALSNGAKSETLYGLSGMGDLCLTCNSIMSRNYRFGYFLAEGCSVEEAKEKIQMVIEGIDTCISGMYLSKICNISMPITEMVYKIIYENIKPIEAVGLLMQRSIKKEHL